MGRKNRQHSRDAPAAPVAVFDDPEHGTLDLRGAMTPATRAEYSAIEGVREDAWQRRVEFLFERLAVSWRAAGVTYERQRELLARFRAASNEERTWIRGVLRDHLAEHFPEMDAP